MKKIKLLILLAILFLTSALQAQDYWSRRYDINRGNDDGFNIMTTDSFIYIETFGLCDNNSIGCYGVMKLDYQGNLVKQMVIDTIFRTNSSIGATVLFEDKIYMNVHYRQPFHQDSSHVFAVLVYDLDLNFLDIIDYGTYHGFPSYSRGIEVTDDGFYINSGEGVGGNDYYNLLSYYDTGWNLKWEVDLHQLIPYRNGSFSTIRGLPDGGAYIGVGGCESLGECAGVFLKLDSVGDLEWLKDERFDIGVIGSSAPIEIYKPDGGLVGLWKADTTVLWTYWLDPPVLYRYAANGDLIWEKLLLTPWGQRLMTYDVSITPSGNIIVTGYWDDYDYFNAPNEPQNHGGYIGCFSPTGETLWQRRIFDDTQGEKKSWFNRAYALDNGDLIFTGTIRDTLPDDPYPWNAWIVKTDSMGCLEPGCQDTTLYVVDSEEPFLIKKPASFLLFPNPTQGEMRLGISTATQLPKGTYQYKIYDPFGRSLIAPRRIENPNILQSIDVGFLPSGLYYMIIERDGVGFEQILFLKE